MLQQDEILRGLLNSTDNGSDARRTRMIVTATVVTCHATDQARP
jgi:hypothetical protein